MYHLYNSLISDMMFTFTEMPRQMSNEERLRAIGMLDAGSSYRLVARHFRRSPNTIRSLFLKWRATRSVAHASAHLNRHHTTARADRRLIRTVRANPTMPATLLRLVWGERNRRGNILSAHADSEAPHQGDCAAMPQDAPEATTLSSSCCSQRTLGNAESALEATTMAARYFY